MSVYSLVQTSIRNAALVALNEYPSAQVIFSHAAGVEPVGSYVVINILSIDQQGHASTSTLTNQSEELTVSGSYEILTQFSFVGKDSGDMAQSFTQRINNNPLSWEANSLNKLGFMRKSQIRRAPQKRDTRWVEYHNIDITFSYTVNTQQVVDIIEAVVIEDNTKIPPIIFTVPPGITLP